MVKTNKFFPNEKELLKAFSNANILPSDGMNCLKCKHVYSSANDPFSPCSGCNGDKWEK